MTDPLFTPLKSHPSTWEAEVKALRAALADAVRHLEQYEPFPQPCFQRARAALQQGGGAEVEALRRRIAELEDGIAKERKAHEKEVACLEENYEAVLRKIKLYE